MILGITGGTGSGKTTLLDVIRAMGGLVLDCDAIYHDLLKTDRELLAAIENRFPGTVCDGSLDRKRLGTIVFSDENALKEKISDSPQNAEIPKLISTLKRFVNRDIGQNVWQRSYHDHIIRNETSYNGIWEYIEHNASEWKDDCFYTK